MALIMSSQSFNSFEPSSSKTSRRRYEVFLSFRGADVRPNFLEYLYRALQQKSILTFKDNVELKPGEIINDALLEAIEESKIAVVVLSKNYANSSWCLRELVHILECMRTNGLVVYPVFYHVSPSDVCKQGGDFGEEFAKACSGKEEVEVNGLKDALTEVGRLKGWDYPHALFENEANLIDNLVQTICSILNNRNEIFDKDLVGIRSRVEQAIECLELGSEETRVVGLWGMGGIGKTTLAKAVYSSVSWRFEGCSFVENARELMNRSGVKALQEQIISDILKGDKLVGGIATFGSSIIWNKVCPKKVLLVFDDVSKHNSEEVEYFIKMFQEFSLGSRIIITSRDRHVLTVCGAHDVYNVQGLNKVEAAQLFKSKAFSKMGETEEFQMVIGRALDYAQGVPLALKVLGSFLMDRTLPEWKNALDRLRESPNYNLQHVLRISYNDLDHKDKDIFLDIACFYKNMEVDRVINILESCGLDPSFGITLLVEKSLLTFSTDNELRMHDLIQEMGRFISDEESRKEPAAQRRLWRTGDIKHVLMENMGTKSVRGLWLTEPVDIPIQPDAFAKMKNLRHLRMYGTCRPIYIPYQLRFLEWVPRIGSPRCSINLPNMLCFLDWYEYPFKSLPSTFQPELLVELHLNNSRVTQLWGRTMVLPKLTVMELNNSGSLTKSPEFTGFPNLEHLFLRDCTALVEIDPSIRHLEKLRKLNLGGCSRLKTLPHGIQSQCLEVLNFSGCSKLDNIFERFRGLKQLLFLNLRETGITELPESIGNSTDLMNLNCTKCTKLKRIPGSIGKLKKLGRLLLGGCSSLNELPEELRLLDNLLDLDVSFSGVKQLPSSVLQLANLRNLSLKAFFSKASPSISEISSATPMDFSGFLNLRRLDLQLYGLKSVPESISLCSSLEQLSMGGDFESLPAAIKDLRNLKWFALFNCPCLQKLPELPPSVTHLHTSDCESLRIICNPTALTNTKYLNFTGCPKLVGSEEIKIISGYKFLEDHMKVSSNSRSYSGPGLEVPEWIRFKSSGSSLKSKFKWPAEDLNTFKWWGFTFSAVVETKHEACTIWLKIVYRGTSFFKIPLGSFPPKSTNVVMKTLSVPRNIADSIWDVCFVRSYSGRWEPAEEVIECGMLVEGVTVTKGGLKRNYDQFAY